MRLLAAWVQTPAAKALGFALVHFVWEGAAIALGLAAVLSVIRASRARYTAACLAMLVMLAGFGLTFGRLLPQPRIQGAIRVQISGAPYDSGSPRLGAMSPAPRRAEDFPPWLAPFWIAGVLMFQLRILASWIGAQRLRRTGVCSAPDFWQRRLAGLGASVRLSTPVTLLESCLADVPVVIGYLRPVILMPVGLLTGLPAGQIESILLHELAHIRRYDYLVNLLQTSVEGLLFYHPAVWWVSKVIRAERENCCDDLVILTHGNAHEYALALNALEQNRCATREAALAATGGNLVQRIRRLLDQPEGPRTALTPAFSAAILTIAAALALAAWQTATPAAPSPGSPRMKSGPARTARPSASPYRLWLDQDVAYIVTDAERDAFLRLATDAERVQFIEQFWLRRDPTPGTPENEAKEEHYRRIAYSNERYAAADSAGWETDRGRTYITLGPPDEIESHPSGGMYARPPEEGGGTISTFPFEQWLYRRVEGARNEIKVEFVDKGGGYRMTLDPREKDSDPGIPSQPGDPIPAAAPGTAKLPMQARVDFYPSTASSVLTNITVQIENKDLQFLQATRDVRRAGVTVYGRITTLERRVTNVFMDRITVDSPAGLHSEVSKRSSVYQKSVPLPPGQYRLTLVLRDVASGATNNSELELNVPRF